MLVHHTDVNQVEVMHRLRHPHVLQLLGVCEAPLALVTELCGAGSLESLLRKGHPSMASWKRRLLVATYAAQALEYLHLSQVLHNDIKAANVLLTSDLTVKLADYGAAVQLGGPGDVSDAAANHNPRWLAPELIKDASGSFPADVYAFGVLLFELLAWDVPFGKTTKDAEVRCCGTWHLLHMAPPAYKTSALWPSLVVLWCFHCESLYCVVAETMLTLLMDAANSTPTPACVSGGSSCGARGMASGASRPTAWRPLPPRQGP